MLKRLSNLGEQKVHDEIVGAAEEYQAHIYRKVRIADVVDISRLSGPGLSRYALQAHFDFCVCNESHVPAFAIEYDGGGHSAINDAKKDEIALQAGLALFRIDERLLNRTRGGVTFLQYLVHTYFLGNAFLEMQEKGQLDPTEPFMMSGFLKKDARHIFDSDFNYSGVARGRLTKIMTKAGVPDGANISSVDFRSDVRKGGFQLYRLRQHSGRRAIRVRARATGYRDAQPWPTW
ncbi:DUF2726 domain-containing protein [Sphingomonas suaedae]|uniref:DUF2726 domain-containing protein n=1 Tax=Sphingomonas suaedae TaxID=2599297 RepID=A0A518RE93_9SPHN|nr:DUF2726 domain-containing protein [Sphingomonas suaedae]QDX25731.1 DUF2726 domain-containing protein [Sphingomonas suaedae]